MNNYNFLNLTPFEFEDLTRDLLQKHLNVFLESFTNAKDKGIDFRYSENRKNNIIVQCKRFKNYKSLKSNLKKEKRKVDVLKPERYILVTSVGLTPSNKEEILNIFDIYIKGYADIIGKDDLNNLIGQYPEIEKNHFNLWLSSTDVLEKILNNDVINRSEFEEESIKKNIRLYVKNNSYNEAVNILNKYNYVIISGIPGIGKTTLAKILIYNYLIKDYQLIVISSDINEAEKFYEIKKKQIFYYDDFLGRNFLEEKLSKNEDQRLTRFIQKIKNNSNKKLIMTTREYILNQAKMKYEVFENARIEIGKCIIDLEKYTRLIRAKILYNHVFFSEIPQNFVNSLLDGKKYLEIINHLNYNPRIVEFMTDKSIIDHTDAINYYNIFLQNLNNPINIWKHVFENQISNTSKYILYCLLISGDQIFIEDLKKTFSNLVKNESKKYNFTLFRDNFMKSLKELENTFIKITKYKDKHLISFQNPSIRDFLINYVKDDKDLIKVLLKSALYLNQLLNIFVVKKNKFNNLINLDNDNIYLLEKLVIERYNNFNDCTPIKVYYSFSKEYCWEKRSLSNTEKLYRIATFFDLKKSMEIKYFLEKKIIKIIENKNNKFSNNDISTLIALIKEIIDFVKIDETKVVDLIVSNIIFTQEISDFIQIKKIFPEYYRNYVNKNRLYLISIFEKVIGENIDSVDDSEYLYDLENIESELKVDLSKYKYKLKDKINNKNEIEDKDEDLDTYEEDNEINEIDENKKIEEMFDTLRK